VWQLVLWRTLLGLGMGGEWSAGSVLVAETWRAEHRGKAVGVMQSGWAVGYIIAAALAALILPRFGWRPLFLIGVLPALLALWIRRNVPEPARWSPSTGSSWTENFRAIFGPTLLARTLTATFIATLLLFAYWGLFTWVPTFLAAPVERGGAGMGIVKSTGWIVPMQLGALAGYLSFGFLADRFGRRPVFLLFVLSSAVIVPVLRRGGAGRDAADAAGSAGRLFRPRILQRVRRDAARSCIPRSSARRLRGSVTTPAAPSRHSRPRPSGRSRTARGLGGALGFTAMFYVFAGLLIFRLPETRGRSWSDLAIG
jgi:MFS family permease